MDKHPSRGFINGAVVTSVLLAVISIGAIWNATSFESAPARTMPLVLGVPTALMAILIVFKEITSSRRKRSTQQKPVTEDVKPASVSDPREEADIPSTVVEDSEAYSTMRLVALAVLFGLSIAIAGHQIGMTIFLLIAQGFLFKLGWLRTVVTTILVMLVFGWFWVHFLNLPVYRGVLDLPVF